MATEPELKTAIVRTDGGAGMRLRRDADLIFAAMDARLNEIEQTLARLKASEAEPESEVVNNRQS